MLTSNLERIRYIGEAAQEAGTTVKAVHYYERVGLIPPARRSGTYRIYDHAAIDRIRFIKCCQHAGFSLAEIRQVLPRYTAGRLSDAENVALVRSKRQAVERQIAALVNQAQNLAALEQRLTVEQEASCDSSA